MATYIRRREFIFTLGGAAAGDAGGQKIVTLAAHYKIPAMYPLSASVFDGGLMSYGIGRGFFRQVGFHYVGQILKGVKPNDLPVQQPNKFELVINLKTARTLGIDVPDQLLALADEVIE